MKKAQMGGSYASRRAYKGQPSTPKSPKKDDSSSPKVETIKSKTSKGNQDYKLYSESEIDNYTPTSREPEKRRVAPSTPAKTDEKKGSSGGGKKAATSTTKVTASAPSKPGIRAKVPISSSKVSSTLNIPKREAVDVTYKPKEESKTTAKEERSYSKTEKKMMSPIEKIKKGKDTEISQIKIKALQDKKRGEKIRAERKEDRTENKAGRIENRAEKKSGRIKKRAAVKTARANVKSVKKSFK